MSYFRTCPHCGAALDPGEVCDCTAARYRRLTPENRNKFYLMVDSLLKEQKAPASAANAGEGGVEQVDKAVSIFNDTTN